MPSEESIAALVQANHTIIVLYIPFAEQLVEHDAILVLCGHKRKPQQANLKCHACNRLAAMVIEQALALPSPQAQSHNDNQGTARKIVLQTQSQQKPLQYSPDRRYCEHYLGEALICHRSKYTQRYYRTLRLCNFDPPSVPLARTVSDSACGSATRSGGRIHICVVRCARFTIWSGHLCCGQPPNPWSANTCYGL